LFQGHWKATVRDLDAVLTGAVEVPVTREPVDIRGLLEAEADEDLRPAQQGDGSGTAVPWTAEPP
jgi:hypothetical protein